MQLIFLHNGVEIRSKCSVASNSLNKSFPNERMNTPKMPINSSTPFLKRDYSMMGNLEIPNF